MKQTLFFILTALIMLTSCKKDEVSAATPAPDNHTLPVGTWQLDSLIQDYGGPTETSWVGLNVYTITSNTFENSAVSDVYDLTWVDNWNFNIDNGNSTGYYSIVCLTSTELILESSSNPASVTREYCSRI